MKNIWLLLWCIARCSLLGSCSGVLVHAQALFLAAQVSGLLEARRNYYEGTLPSCWRPRSEEIFESTSKKLDKTPALCWSVLFEAQTKELQERRSDGCIACFIIYATSVIKIFPASEHLFFYLVSVFGLLQCNLECVNFLFELLSVSVLFRRLFRNKLGFSFTLTLYELESIT